MGKWLLGICIALLGATMMVTDADAKRLGGGRSVGAQRNVTPAPAKPAQQAAPQQQPQSAQPAQQGSRWGMLAGMNDQTMAPPPSQPEARPSGAVVAAEARVPAGFDAAGFLRAAKMNFIKLQVANDSGRLDDIREFTTREMYDELRTDSQGAHQQTDVVALNADLLELATERDQHWASVRFSGMVRETPGTEPVGFEEVWNLVKPADGSSGWLLAGIQQMH